MKKFLIIFTAIIFIVNYAIAEVNTANSTINFEKVNKKVLKNVQKAREAKNFNERQQYYIKAVKYLKKKKTDDIVLKSGIYYLLANDAKNNKNNEVAINWYKEAYLNLENNNLIKDNYLALGCMMNIINIAKKEKDDDLYNETLLKIEKTQLGLSKKYPIEIRQIYGMLFEYYNNRNLPKAEEYEKIIKSYN